ncbi:MAG: hypothetical protein ACHP79_07535, partial [Terriglobales bacterium]
MRRWTNPKAYRKLAKLPVILLCLALAGPPLVARAQSAPSEQQLFQQERWTELVQLLEKIPQRSAEQEFEYGVALAKLSRWDEARHALVAGSRLAPQDKRFPSELAGIEFKQKKYGAAAAHLRRALRL